MAKSRKEIQKDYRERQKAKDPGFLQKERQRQRSYYVPAAQLSKKKREERNRKNKLRNRLSRFRKREREESRDSRIEETSGYESGTGRNEHDDNRLIVRIPRVPNLPSSSKAKGLKKTRKRALARAHQNISSLREEVKKLHKRIKTKNKQIERLTKKTKRSQNVNSSELTPRKQTEMEVEKLKLTPKRSRFVRRKLLVSNALLSELKTTRKLHSAKKRRILHQIVSGGITKKYRCLNKLNTYTGLSRRSMSKVVGKKAAC